LLRYLGYRVLEALVTAWIVVTILFVVFRLMPGDPASFLVDPELPEAARIQMRESLGLDRPLVFQYLEYVGDLARGDLGRSFWYRSPVATIIGEKLSATIILAVASFILAYGLGILGGMAWAATRRSRVEAITNAVMLFIRSVPTFWLGILAVTVFAVNLRWFPASGFRTPGYSADNFFELYFSGDALWHLALPALVLGISHMVAPMLMLRDSIVELEGEPFMELIRAKGVSRWRELMHATRNALIPVTTTAAVFLGTAIGGQVLIETVFSFPGLGREIVASVARRDYAMAQSSFFLLSLTVIGFNMLADLLYGFLDPRIRGE
jgi:peptide/nickel transport system permease protein